MLKDSLNSASSFAVIALAALVVGPTAASGQNQTPPPCSAEEHRLFDFWEGVWSVTPQNRPNNTNPPSRNEITRKLNGCVLHEHYTTAGGYEGESFNIYDRTRGVWHQTWVDTSGLLLQIEGTFVDGRMVLEGPGINGQGQTVTNRISWNRIDGNPDRVRQLWEASTDDGETWTVLFDGLYTRVGTD